MTDGYIFPDKVGPIRVHVMRRMLQRLGADSTTQDLKFFADAIHKGGGTTFVERVSKRCTIHKVEHKGRVWKVIYDNGRCLVKTIMEFR